MQFETKLRLRADNAENFIEKTRIISNYTRMSRKLCIKKLQKNLIVFVSRSFVIEMECDSVGNAADVEQF